MNIRRAILLLLVIILGIILAYNYWIMNYMVQSGVGMGLTSSFIFNTSF